MFNEDNTMEQMIISTLKNNGWNYIPADSLPRVHSDVMVEPMVKKALIRLNPEIAADHSRADEVIYKLRTVILSVLPHNLVTHNELFKKMIFEENSYPFGKNGRMVPIRFFGTLNTEDLSLNEYVVTNQWVYPKQESGKRLDIVLLINGFPIAIGELKTPVRNAITWLDGAGDIASYEKSIPEMFVTNVFNFATEGKCFRYGAVNMPIDMWGPWHTSSHKSEGSLSDVKISIEDMLVPKKIMDIFQFFTIFATDKKYRKYKIICRYQQYEGANLIVNRVVAGYPKKGLLWHFQGSGKSLLMIFAAQKLRMLPELKNPTVVIVDDRIDLETQITANFNASDIPNLESAATKEGLMDFFRGDMRKILITTIFKFGEVDRELNPRTNIIQMAVMTTAKGNYRFAYLYQNQKMENFLDSHVRFFNHIGGVHKEIVYDNMKVAVARFVSKSEKVPTEDLLKISMYYGFNYRFCNTRRGNEKGHVEKSVEYIRRKVFSKKDDFKTLEEANKYLEEQLGKLNSKKQKYNEDKTAKDMIKEELPYLIKLMPTYDISRVVDLRVNKYSVVTIDENKYSVPDSLVGKFVTAKIYPQNILIYHDNKKQAQHIRSFGSHTWSIEIKHYLNTLKKKPGAIHKSTAMHQMNPKLQNIYTKYYTQNPKDFLDLIEIISEEGIESIEKTIKTLEKISPLNINTEKIRMICSRKEEITARKTEKNTEIEEHSKSILNHYGSLLKNSSEDFDKEALII